MVDASKSGKITVLTEPEMLPCTIGEEPRFYYKLYSEGRRTLPFDVPALLYRIKKGDCYEQQEGGNAHETASDIFITVRTRSYRSKR
jgi:hypothetical protein